MLVILLSGRLIFPANVLLMLLWAVSIADAQETSESGTSQILSIDHYVRQISKTPSIEGQFTQLYVRERALPDVVSGSKNLDGQVVLFVHGARTPSEVAFDVPYQGYSWMAYLAQKGFDVFAVDLTGYGRSTRPHFMNDPCNLPEDDQRALEIGITHGPCEPSYSFPMTTYESDWADIDRVVEFIRKSRSVESISLIGWSRGGPRAGAYTAQNASKVDKLVLLAPSYIRSLPSERPSEVPVGAAFRGGTQERFKRVWNRQVGCSNQYDPIVQQIIWDEQVASDRVGKTWGSGTYRAPASLAWGWNKEIVQTSATPTLLFAGVYDDIVPPERVHELYEDLGANSKVLVDLACSSHNALWEKNRGLMFKASLEWLQFGTVDGKSSGILQMGD